MLINSHCFCPAGNYEALMSDSMSHECVPCGNFLNHLSDLLAQLVVSLVGNLISMDCYVGV